MSKTITLFFSDEIDAIEWPKAYEGSLIKEYFLMMMKQGAEKFVSNGISKLAILQIGDKFIPLTINDTEFSNSYVTSIYSYLPYAKQEMLRHKKNLLFYIMHPLFKLLSIWFKKTSINRIVIVNNFLFSTNLYDHLTEVEIKQIHCYLIKNFPSHTIMFRSLNNRIEKALMNALKDNAYNFITSRSVYFFDPEAFQNLPHKKRWIYTKDQKLLLNEGISILEHDEFSKQDVSKIKELYDMLYLKKYSYLNPQFTKAFFSMALKSKSFTLQGIKYHNELIGVIGHFTQKGIMTTPIVGYDTTKPIELGLYRMLTALVLRHSLQSKKMFHMSSGIGHFKRQRGATQEFESMGVYTNHLPLSRQLPWKFLQFIFNRLAKSIISKNKL